MPFGGELNSPENPVIRLQRDLVTTASQRNLAFAFRQDTREVVWKSSGGSIVHIRWGSMGVNRVRLLSCSVSAASRALR